MKKVYQFKKVVTYEVEAGSYDEAIYLRDDLDGIMNDTLNNEVLDRETVEPSKWIFTNEIPVKEIEDTILRACGSCGIVDDNDNVYGLTDKGRAYLAALNGEGDYDENDYDENGKRIEHLSYKGRCAKYSQPDPLDDFCDDEDIEDEFYDYITED